MSLSATLIAVIKKIHQLPAEAPERQQKVAQLQQIITRSMAVHAEVCGEDKDLLTEDDTINGKDKDGLTPLMWAAKLGLSDVMAILIAGNPEHGVPGAKLDAVDNDGRHVLHHAAEAGQLAAVKLIFEHEQGRALLERRDTKTDSTPLFSAAGAHRAEVVKYLVEEQKANVHAVAKTTVESWGSDQVPIVAHMLSVRRERDYKNQIEVKIDESQVLACLEVLHAAGADFNAPRWGLNRDTQDSEYSRSHAPLGLAAAYGLVRVWEFMLDHGVNPNVVDKEHEAPGYRRTMIERAISKTGTGYFGSDVPIKARAAMVQALLKKNPASRQELQRVLIFAESQVLDHQEGKTPASGLRAVLQVPQFLAETQACKELFLSAIGKLDFGHSNEGKGNKKKIEIVKAFIEENAVNQGMVDEGVIKAAAVRGESTAQFQLVKMLCEAKPAPSQKALDQALVAAIEHDKCTSQMLILLVGAGARLAAQGANSQTVFDVMVKKDPSGTAMSHLRNLLALPQVKENQGAMAMCQKKLQQLKSEGAKSAHIVRAFEESGIKVEAPVPAVVVEAKVQAAPAAVASAAPVGGQVMHTAPVSQPTREQLPLRAVAAVQSVATAAAENKIPELIQVVTKGGKGDKQRFDQLLAAGTDVNVKDDLGYTVLHFMVMPNSVFKQDDLRKLLEAKADLNAVNVRGETPLILSAKVGNKEAIQFLLAQKADKTVRDKAGKTAEDYVRMSFPGMISLFDTTAAAAAAAAAPTRAM